MLGGGGGGVQGSLGGSFGGAGKRVCCGVGCFLAKHVWLACCGGLDFLPFLFIRSLFDFALCFCLDGGGGGCMCGYAFSVFV